LALNEEEPEKFEDLLEPDYEGLKKFEPVINKFRDVFYDGEKEDPECAVKPKGQRGGAAANRKRVARPEGATSSQVSHVSKGAGRGRGGRAKAEKVAEFKVEDDEDDMEIPMSKNVGDTGMQKKASPAKQRKGKIGMKKRKVENDEDSEEIPISKYEGRSGRVSAPRSNSRGNSQKSQKSKSGEDKIKEACKDGSIKDYKVQELRDILTSLGLPSKGVKNFLISLIKEYYD